MKKIFTLAAAVLTSVGMWAATETVPKFSDNWTGTSISFTNAEGANGSSDQKKDGDAENVTYVKFRTNKNGNTITLNVTDGYQVTGLYLRGYTNDGSTSVSLNSVKYDDADAITTNLEFPLSGAGTTATYENNTDVARNAIVLQMSNSGKQLMAVLRVTYSLACTDPEFTVSPTEGTGFVGDPIDIAVTSKNQSKPINSAVTVDGVPGVYGTDYTFSVSTGLVQATPLKAGTFVVTFSQASNGTYCDAEESATFVISAKTPVASVTIDGPAAGFVGQELTYTATAEGATAYQWLVDGVDANTNAATFKYTAVKGSHSIVCKARNQFNAENEWIASDPIALTVTSLYGQLIAADAETGSGNIDKDITATGIVGGTVHQKSQKNAKLGSNGHYFSLTLAAGSFLAGDTVKVVVTPEYNSDKDTYSAPTQLKISTALDNSNLIGVSDTKVIDPASDDDLYFDIVLTEGASTIYLARDGSICKQNPIVKSISVIRPVAIKSTVVSLSAVTINDVAIESSDLAKLVGTGEVILADSYLNAPVVKFTKHTVITYEDNSQKESDEVIEKTSTQATASTWGASATIGENSYSVYTVKTMSYVVTYMFGTEELGTENVAQNSSPVNYATYQTLNDGNLSTFAGWYNDADLAEGHAVADIAAEVITANTTYYAKFNYKYATSINIEQWVLDNAADSAHTVALLALLGTNNYASNISYKKGTNELDSLSDKTDRNEPYLGLKVKESGKLINFRLAPESIVKVKFGETKTTPKVAINGGEYTDMTLTEKVYTYTATGEDLVSIYISEANKAVVFKQIMINQAIQDVTLPDVPTALDNTEATVKATKRIVNGQLFIEKNGVMYNAQGAVVR